MMNASSELSLFSRLRIRVIILIFIFSQILYGQTFSKNFIKTTRITKNIYYLFIDDFVSTVVFNGPEGALLIDTGNDSYNYIKEELSKIGVKNIKYIINTHSHFDHIGGNSILGNNAVIIASEKCREAIHKDYESEVALPAITFKDSLSLFFNNEKIDLYFTPGHSDNDIIVYIRNSNVVHIGDLGFFEDIGEWPGLDGDAYLYRNSFRFMNNIISDDTIILTSHGHKYTNEHIIEHYKMLDDTIKKIEFLIKKDFSLEQIIKLDPLSESSYLFAKNHPIKWIENIFNRYKKND